MPWLAAVHDTYIQGRRIRVLARHLLPLIQPGARLLDVGAGDGRLGRALAASRSDLEVRGVDVLVRPGTAIPVEPSSEAELAFLDDEFDVAMLIDVLHHASDPIQLLAECRRVAPVVIVKDHLCDGVMASATLRLMDWVGNAQHGVRLRYDYWRREQWKRVFGLLAFRVTAWESSLGLYPKPASWLFDRHLHFVARLERIS
jgi:SAM-dependent methyltransferase